LTSRSTATLIDPGVSQTFKPFAKQIEDRDKKDRFAAAVEAARLRLRPILMNSFAFIFGVLPLVLSKGSGAKIRQALGTAVFFGMPGVTGFGLFLTRFLRRHHVVQRAPHKKLLRPPQLIRTTVGGGTNPLVRIMDANLGTGLAGVLARESFS
jgi:hypothetical protein